MSRAAPRRVPVFVVLPPQALLLDVAGPMEVLRKADQIQDEVRFDVSYVGPRPAVTSSIGLALAGIGPLPESLPADAHVVLSGTATRVFGAEAAPTGGQEGDEAAIVTWLARVFRPGMTLVAICSGALLAGRAGLLHGRDCTTHFESCADLARLVPDARVLENRLFVEDGPVLTSAGVTAGTDLMLHLLSRLVDPACAAAVARFLVVYLRRGGADPQLSPWLEGRNHLHPAVHRVQDAVSADPARAWSLETLAEIACTSPRHLSRLFNEHAGMSLPDYVNALRVALARNLLQTTQLDMERIAERSGFASSRQLRRAWGRYEPAPPRSVRLDARPG